MMAKGSLPSGQMRLKLPWYLSQTFAFSSFWYDSGRDRQKATDQTYSSCFEVLNVLNALILCLCLQPGTYGDAYPLDWQGPNSLPPTSIPSVQWVMLDWDLACKWDLCCQKDIKGMSNKHWPLRLWSLWLYHNLNSSMRNRQSKRPKTVPLLKGRKTRLRK